MKNDTRNNIKLGLFVSAGLLMLIVSLYLIGKNQNFFGANFYIRARFTNISGLVTGNNVRYSGIQAGTVSDIQVLNDTTIEVTLLISKKLKAYIHENTYAAIGNDGLMGNKVINLAPNKSPAPLIAENGLLATKEGSTDEMMETLAGTNNNVKIISEKVIYTIDRLNNSPALWKILNDTTLPQNLSNSISNIREASMRINQITSTIDGIAQDLKNGKGAAGVLLSDERSGAELKNAITTLNKATTKADDLLQKVNNVVSDVQKELASGKGPVHAILKDTAMTSSLSTSLINIEKGTAAFSQDMEALKHNFLIRGYFRKQARKNKKAGTNQSTDSLK